MAATQSQAPDRTTGTSITPNPFMLLHAFHFSVFDLPLTIIAISSFFAQFVAKSINVFINRRCVFC